MFSTVSELIPVCTNSPVITGHIVVLPVCLFALKRFREKKNRVNDAELESELVNALSNNYLLSDFCLQRLNKKVTQTSCSLNSVHLFFYQYEDSQYEKNGFIKQWQWLCGSFTNREKKGKTLGPSKSFTCLYKSCRIIRDHSQRYFRMLEFDTQLTFLRPHIKKNTNFHQAMDAEQGFFISGSGSAYFQNRHLQCSA